MTAFPADVPPIRQVGAAALVKVEPDACVTEPQVTETCLMHDWTCIWCSMNPPICGSCRPVTPPCPANGLIHVCACHSREHSAEAA